MEVSDLYQRFVYRDILGYALPGAIFSYSLVILLLPQKINNSIEINAATLFLLLGIGFMIGHIVSVLPRELLRKALANRIYKKLSEIIDISIYNEIIKFFDSNFEIIDKKWNDIKENNQRFMLIKRFVKAQGENIDHIERAESIRIFLENAIILIPISLLANLIKLKQNCFFDFLCLFYIFLGVAIILFLIIWAYYSVSETIIQFYFDKFFEMNLRSAKKSRELTT